MQFSKEENGKGFLLPLLSILALLCPSLAGVASAGVNTWTTNGPAGAPWINTLAIDPLAPATLYAGGNRNFTVGAVFKSTNGGGSWTLPSSSTLGLEVIALAI